MEKWEWNFLIFLKLQIFSCVYFVNYDKTSGFTKILRYLFVENFISHKKNILSVFSKAISIEDICKIVFKYLSHCQFNFPIVILIFEFFYHVITFILHIFKILDIWYYQNAINICNQFDCWINWERTLKKRNIHSGNIDKIGRVISVHFYDHLQIMT